MELIIAYTFISRNKKLSYKLAEFYVLFKMVAFKIRFSMDMRKAMSKAKPNPSMTKPSPTILCVMINMKALITNRNKPSVRIVAGNVNKISRGRTRILTSAKMKLAKMAKPILST